MSGQGEVPVKRYAMMTEAESKAFNDDVHLVMVALCERHGLPARYHLMMLDDYFDARMLSNVWATGRQFQPAPVEVNS